MAQERNRLTEERLEAFGRRLSFFLALAIPGPLLFLLFLNFTFPGLMNADAMDCAQLARHISQGHGFVTSYIRPLSLTVHNAANSHPDLLRAPLHPFILALFFGAFGASDKIAAICSGIFYLAAIPLIYFLAKRMFDRRTAIISTILYTISLPLLDYSISGLALPLAIFMLTLLFFLLYKTQNSLRNTILCGLIFSLCYLTGYTFLVLLLPVLIYIYFANETGKFKHLAAFLITFIIVIAPWLYRNYTVTGSPLFTLRRYDLLLFTTTYPAYSLYRTIAANLTSPLIFAITHIPEILKKFVISSSGLYTQLPVLFNLYIVPFFILSIFFTTGKRQLEILRICLYLMILMLLFDKSLTHPAPELFAQFIPIIIILATATFLRLLDRQVRYSFVRNLAVVILILIVLYPVATKLTLNIRAGGPVKNPAIPNLQFIAKNMPQDEVIISDTPWAVAWYADRNCIWLPQTAEDFEKIDKIIPKVDYIYLSAMLPSYTADERVDNWKGVYFSRRPFRIAPNAEFIPVAGLRGPELLYVRTSKISRKSPG